MERKRVITSLDLAKREEILPGLRQAHWDLVVVDEAHRMSARDKSHKSQRYRLGRAAPGQFGSHAPPHGHSAQGGSAELHALPPVARPGRLRRREVGYGRPWIAGEPPFYLRRTKEAMVYFPEREADGTWTARPVFTKRIAHTADFAIDGAEFELYREVTRFVKRQSRRAADESDNPRARAVGFPDVAVPEASRFEHLCHEAVA